MEAKHTKGPWRRIGRTIVDNQGRVEISVASTNDTEDAHVNENHRVEKSEAFSNAQLISAAPDMYEALKYAQEIIGIAKRYFPKSVMNGDKYSLLNLDATKILYSPSLRAQLGIADADILIAAERVRRTRHTRAGR